MDEWIELLRQELGIEDEIPVDDLLDAARVVAHRVERKATPVTTYLMGVAVGSGRHEPVEVATRVAALAREHGGKPDC